MQLNQFQQDIESDNDEGFIPSKIIIKEKKPLSFKKSSNQILQKKQFVSRYISEGIMRKEPPECYKRFSKFDYLQDSVNSINPSEENIQSTKEIQSLTNIDTLYKGKTKQKLITPYDKFVASGDYNLVYSRYKEFSFLKQEIQFAKNQIKLDCLRCQQDVNYKQIKPFQIIQEKTEEVIKLDINSNMSIRQKLLKFDSRFECGNLLCAYQHKQEAYKYYLFIQNDTNTNGYNQWFYFSIKNAQVGVKYQFNILNFRKRNSFFKEGNKPIIFSLMDSKNPQKSGYSKRGENVIYKRSPIIKSYDSKQKFFQLSFELKFQNEEDIYYISMGLPYSYSKLINNLNHYQSTAQSRRINWKMESIGTTIAGNRVPYVTITKQSTRQQSQNQTFTFKNKNSLQYKNQEDEEDQFFKDKSSIIQKQVSLDQKNKQQKKKRVIFIISRQHPGQTWSSYLVDEFLYSLSHITCPEVEYLLENFIIKCVPMINIDGVINGNFRCDLSGVDLNRNWKNPSIILHPQIYSIKNEINNLVANQGYKVECCFDLHGHSKQYNVFCYSCKTDNIQCRILPYIFQQFQQDFYFPFCTFGISKYKQSTARAVIFNIIKNTNVLTIQSSFFASKINGQLKVFQPQSFKNISQMIIKGCKSYFSQDENYQEAMQTIKTRLNQFIQYKDQSENAYSGSDSEPSGDQIQSNEKFAKILPKSLIKKCLQQQKSKQIQKRPRNSKRQTLQVPIQKSSIKLKKISYNSQHQNRTLIVLKDENVSKTQKKNHQKIKYPKRSIEEKTISFFNKKSIQKLQQTIQASQDTITRKLYFQQLLQKDERKLPFFTKEKPQMVPMKLKNESFQIFRDAYNATQKCIKHDEFTLQDLKNQRRNPGKKLGLFHQKLIQKQQQFPLLCVLSQNKKRNHVQKIKQKNDKQKNELRNDQMSEKVKTAIQTRTEAIRMLREKNKNSMELVSKIWRQNFTRYGMAFSTFKIAK